ncbi:hypothetical protein C5S53_10705 [Methanophagales archaeon]|nr:hypothetical protein C5S53_10705 [Methanophagales archaeon]
MQPQFASEATNIKIKKKEKGKKQASSIPLVS